jgi:sugar phosphate isomerase/epimerase
VAERLGATQVRIDAGGPERMPGDVFRVIVAGYEDLVARGRDKGLEILFENHWGPTVVPENVVRLCEAVEGLGLLYDLHEEARLRCARYARATHVKTHGFDDRGNPTEGETARALGAIRETGYRGAWGIESVPRNGDEIDGARKTIKLLGSLLATWNER